MKKEGKKKWTAVRKGSTRARAPEVSEAIPLPGHVLVLRTCHADGRPVHPDAIRTAFVWPIKVGAVVECPDWDQKPNCGNGLHGLLWGEGSTTQWLWDADAKWLVVEVLESEIVEIKDGDGPKVKFPRCRIVFCGDQRAATSFLYDHGGAGHAIVGGTATAGTRGTATAGDAGTATAGYAGTATAGYAGTATAGDAGVCSIRWWNGSRYRYRVREVGGPDGLKPNVRYKLDDKGEFVEVAAEKGA